MTGVLLDTHAWVWTLIAPHRLTETTKAAILRVDSVHVSPVSLYEVAWKIRLGKWPEMAPHLDELRTETETRTARLDRATAARAGMLDWVHRDPFDRLIAATAVELRCPLISRDAAFDELAGRPDWHGRIWS